MTNAPEIEFANPFEVPLPDEKANLAALTRSLRRANGFGLIFAVCNQSELRERLMRDLAARLPEKNILQVPIREPVDSLLTYLTEALELEEAETPPDAVFVYGLESWLPAQGDEPGAGFLANLNLFRNNFPKHLPCPMVLWVPQHILADIQDRAPDFASIRSGVYVFSMTSEARSQFLTNYSTEQLTTIVGLTLEEKLERITRLEHLLKEFQSLPKDQRNLLDEAPLMTSLAFTYYGIGRFDKVELLLQTALQIYRDNFPAHHPSIVSALNNLALLYSYQERYTEAEKFFKESLDIDRLNPLSNSNSIAIGLSNSSLLYSRQKRYTEAETLLKEALNVIRSSTLSNVTAKAGILNALADVYSNTDRDEKAEKLYKEALSIRRASLHSQHPSTAASLNNLAELYIRQGKYHEALPMLQEALKSVEASYGPEHPDTLQVVSNYAALLVLQHQHEQVRNLIARFHLILERIPAAMLDQIMQTKPR